MPRASAALQSVLMLLAGAVTTLSFAPFSWPIFSLVAVISAYLLLQKSRSGFRSGWIFGSGFFGAGVSWVYVSIHYHGGMGVIPAVSMTLAFCLGLGLLFGLQFYLYKRLFRYPSPLGFAGLWLGFEWLRSWLFTGFPWLYLGYGWIDTPLANLAPLGGVWLVSSAVLIVAMLLAYAIQHRSAKPLILGALILPASALLPQKAINTEGRAIDVALIQPNISQSLKWQQSHFEEHIRRLGELSREAESAQWVIWPETAIPRLINNSFDTLSPWLNELEQRKQILVSGFPRREWNEALERWTYLNSLGTLTGFPSIYDKQRLVPFGEYIPLEHWLRGAIEFFNLPMSSFSLPTTPQGSLQVGDQQVAAAICYEIAYPELVRAGVAADAGLIITLSNDTWFTGSHAPAQHLQIARMRALENHRWLIRATNNGLTAVVDPQGRIVETLSQGEAAVLTTRVWPSYEQTLYQRFGSYPTLLFWLVTFVTALIYSRRHRSLKH